MKRPKLPAQVAHAEEQDQGQQSAAVEIKEEQDDGEEEEKKSPVKSGFPGNSSLIGATDMDLMQEFEEDTETICKMSETCYTHYKAMLRQEK